MKLHVATLRIFKIMLIIGSLAEFLYVEIVLHDETWDMLDIENTATYLPLQPQRPFYIAFRSLEVGKYSDLIIYRNYNLSICAQNMFVFLNSAIVPSIS